MEGNILDVHFYNVVSTHVRSVVFCLVFEGRTLLLIDISSYRKNRTERNGGMFSLIR